MNSGFICQACEAFDLIHLKSIEKQLYIIFCLMSVYFLLQNVTSLQPCIESNAGAPIEYLAFVYINLYYLFSCDNLIMWNLTLVCNGR